MEVFEKTIVKIVRFNSWETTVIGAARTPDEFAVIYPWQWDSVPWPSGYCFSPSRLLSSQKRQWIPDVRTQYPCSSPMGKTGAHNIQMSPSKESRLSPTAYIAYRAQLRLNEFSLLLRGGRLFQQYLADMWAAVEQDRFSYDQSGTRV
jgi:hypothetical protein